MFATAPNPYAVGGALSDPDGRGFFGREDIFEFVRESLATERRFPILLFGQRRMGKSSILHQLPRYLPSDYCCVFYDLQGKASMDLDQVLYGLGRAIAERMGIEMPRREQATEGTFHKEFLPQAVAHLDGAPQRLVVLFDEFDVIDERTATAQVAASRFAAYLGELYKLEPQIGYIMVVGRKTEELSAALNCALLKDAVQKRIVRLTREQTVHLVEDQAKGALQFCPEALSRIYELAAGHPYCTQLLSHVVWNLYFRVEGRTDHVTVADVNEAVPTALELGALGMNWIFDGLTEPAHRLFLSALAASCEPADHNYATLAHVETTLHGRRIMADRVNWNTAPRDLEKWDAIKSVNGGFGFAVPLVGCWIALERPLEQLERDVRFSNPKAFQYYELALDAHKREDYDRAVQDYNGALVANPMFFEAQRGLASALSARRKPGDLDAAIEAHERVREIDPKAPATDLINILVESLSHTETPAERFKDRLDRIKQLDTDGMYVARARRAASDRAHGLLATETGASLKNAILLYSALDDAHGLQLTKKRYRNWRFMKWSLISLMLAAIGVMAAYNYLPSYFPVHGSLRVLASALIGASFVGIVEMDSRKPRQNLVAVIFGTIGSFVAFGWWSTNEISNMRFAGAGFVALVIASGVAETLWPTPKKGNAKKREPIEPTATS